mmetsp:Transcript_34386/g.75226  ORF Transcript_34386/g.75226 Transcript_34386/m.75226 type:complete len:220 (-) Transcript_34386:380-1039(-)
MLSQLVQRSDSRKTHHRLRGSQEDLEHGDGMHSVEAEDAGTLSSAIHGGQLAERSGSLVGHHLRPVSEARIQVRHQRLFDGRVSVRHQSLGGIPHQQALSHWALHLALGQLDHNLVEPQTVRLLQLVQQSKGVELHHGVLRASCFLNLVHPPTNDFGSYLHQCDTRQDGRSTHERVLVHNRSLQEALDLVDHGSINDTGEHPNGVRTVAIDIGMHVLGQ